MREVDGKMGGREGRKTTIPFESPKEEEGPGESGRQGPGGGSAVSAESPGEAAEMSGCKT